MKTLQIYDFQHELSFKLVSEKQAIAFETLNVKDMIMNHHLAESIGNSAWSSFVPKIDYKIEWSVETILMISKFKPSSKLCHFCGYHNSELTPKDREWKYTDCKTKHNRDIMLQLKS